MSDSKIYENHPDSTVPTPTGAIRSPLLAFTAGIFFTALLIAVFSVYVLHDVDREQVNHLNAAFKGLCLETVLFTILIGAPVGILTLLGRTLLGLEGATPRLKFAFFLGAGVTIVQYPWDLLTRWLRQYAVGLSLLHYLVLAVVVCTAVLLYDSYRLKRQKSR